MENTTDGFVPVGCFHLLYKLIKKMIKEQFFFFLIQHSGLNLEPCNLEASCMNHVTSFFALLPWLFPFFSFCKPLWIKVSAKWLNVKLRISGIEVSTNFFVIPPPQGALASHWVPHSFIWFKGQDDNSEWKNTKCSYFFIYSLALKMNLLPTDICGTGLNKTMLFTSLICVELLGFQVIKVILKPKRCLNQQKN